MHIYNNGVLVISIATNHEVSFHESNLILSDIDAYSRGSVLANDKLWLIGSNKKDLKMIDLGYIEEKVAAGERIEHGRALTVVNVNCGIQDIQAYNSDVYALNNNGEIFRVTKCSTTGSFQVESFLAIGSVNPQFAKDEYFTLGIEYPYIMAYSQNKAKKVNSLYLIGLYSGRITGTFSYQCTTNRGTLS